MIAGRPSPRWGAAAISYAVASLAAGVVLSSIENLPGLLAGDTGITAIANAAISCLVYGAIAGLNLVAPAAVVGLIFWWFGIESLAAYASAALVIAGGMVAAGLTINDIELIPAALIGGLVCWACMRMAPDPVV